MDLVKYLLIISMNLVKYGSVVSMNLRLYNNKKIQKVLHIKTRSLGSFCFFCSVEGYGMRVSISRHPAD